MNVKFKRLSPHAVAPTYATDLAAGFDLVATEDVIVRPGETAKVPTGLAFELPPGYELQVRPRSGVSLKTKLRVSNSPGTVDADYRGEVAVLVDNIADVPRGPLSHVSYYNALDNGRIKTPKEPHYESDNRAGGRDVEYFHKDEPRDTYIIRRGDRIAQAIIAPVIRATFTEADELSETGRGDGGFGSTGTRASGEGKSLSQHKRDLLAKYPPNGTKEVGA
jgi:dUTP pyrophosphatase